MDVRNYKNCLLLIRQHQPQVQHLLRVISNGVDPSRIQTVALVSQKGKKVVRWLLWLYNIGVNVGRG